MLNKKTSKVFDKTMSYFDEEMGKPWFLFMETQLHHIYGEI